MKYLVKDEYYDLKDEDHVLRSFYSVVDDDSAKGAVMHDFANIMSEDTPKNEWEKLFISGIVGCGTTEVYEFENGHTVGENLIDSVLEDTQEIKVSDLNEN